MNWLVRLIEAALQRPAHKPAAMHFHLADEYAAKEERVIEEQLRRPLRGGRTVTPKSQP